MLLNFCATYWFDANLLIFGAIVLIFSAKFELVQFYQFLVPFY